MLTRVSPLEPQCHLINYGLWHRPSHWKCYLWMLPSKKLSTTMEIKIWIFFLWIISHFPLERVGSFFNGHGFIFRWEHTMGGTCLNGGIQIIWEILKSHWVERHPPNPLRETNFTEKDWFVTGICLLIC